MRGRSQNTGHWVLEEYPKGTTDTLMNFLNFVTIYAHFIPGPFLGEMGPGKDVDYTTAWLTYKF
jgi:hypothetical protein